MSPVKLSIAAGIACVYIVFAILLVREDRKSHTGGFISLQGMMSALLTLPVAFPLEYFGRKMNYRSNWQMGLAIATCSALIFGITLGLLALVCFVFAPAAVSR